MKRARQNITHRVMTISEPVCSEDRFHVSPKKNINLDT